MWPLALSLCQRGQAGLTGPGRRQRRIEVHYEVRCCIRRLWRPLGGRALQRYSLPHLYASTDKTHGGVKCSWSGALQQPQ